MAVSNQSGEFEVKPCPIIGPYNVQRFKQFSPEDSANWYIQQGKNTKRPFSMYPMMGRRHINFAGVNQLIFGTEPRKPFKTIQYAYFVVGNSIYQVDANWNQVLINVNQPINLAGPVYFCYLVINSIVFACFTDQNYIYVYQENNPGAGLQKVTDPNAPGNLITNGVLTKPGYLATFGNRITASCLGSSQFCLSAINLLNASGVFDPATCFTVNGAAVFAQEEGIIRQMGVLNNTLYIWCDFVTGVWSNIPSVFPGTGVLFPWKRNSTYNWNFGIASSDSLDIDFGILAFLAQNSDGLLQYMWSNGGQPEKMSDEAIDVLLQRYTNKFGTYNPFTFTNANGFLYQYENTIFYRSSGGNYTGTGILDQEQNANSIEFKFDTKSWARCIEVNGERNRIQSHIYFNSKHLVTVTGDNTVYEMSGAFYFNEVRNPAQPDPQAADAYYAYPFRYERVTPIISEDDYAEFETEYVEIDFVFGDSIINYSTAPFMNAQFLIDEQLLNGQIQYIIAEQPDQDGQPVFVLADASNTPTLADNTYNYLYNPHIELYYSDDGGITFYSADVLEFSQMGVHIWKMRWYQMGPSRNRVYKLVAVSVVPIVILGAVMNVRRISGGAN